MDIVEAPDMTLREKLAILKAWEADERALQRAEDEGMGGGEHAHLHRVQQQSSRFRNTNPYPISIAVPNPYRSSTPCGNFLRRAASKIVSQGLDRIPNRRITARRRVKGPPLARAKRRTLDGPSQAPVTLACPKRQPQEPWLNPALPRATRRTEFETSSTSNLCVRSPFDTRDRMIR